MRHLGDSPFLLTTITVIFVDSYYNIQHGKYRQPTKKMVLIVEGSVRTWGCPHGSSSRKSVNEGRAEQHTPTEGAKLPTGRMCKHESCCEVDLESLHVLQVQGCLKGVLGGYS